MINKIKKLSRYEQFILCFMAVMAMVFAVIYHTTINRVGFKYKDSIFVASVENENTVYSGKVYGQAAKFTVYPDGKIEFHRDGVTYGPYTVINDPTAIHSSVRTDSAIGFEIFEKEQSIFRGCARNSDGWWMLFNEDGQFESEVIISAVTNNGEVIFGDETEYDAIKPSISSLIELVYGAKQSHKGDWTIWWMGLFVCVMNAISILFKEEIFRWDMSFRIKDADKAQPSDWEYFSRYLGWTVLTVVAAAVFTIGLK